jgi:hypothetical protein
MKKTEAYTGPWTLRVLLSGLIAIVPNEKNDRWRALLVSTWPVSENEHKAMLRHPEGGGIKKRSIARSEITFEADFEDRAVREVKPKGTTKTRPKNNVKQPLRSWVAIIDEIEGGTTAKARFAEIHEAYFDKRPPEAATARVCLDRGELGVWRFSDGPDSEIPLWVFAPKSGKRSKAVAGEGRALAVTLFCDMKIKSGDARILIRPYDSDTPLRTIDVRSEAGEPVEVEVSNCPEPERSAKPCVYDEDFVHFYRLTKERPAQPKLPRQVASKDGFRACMGCCSCGCFLPTDKF